MPKKPRSQRRGGVGGKRSTGSHGNVDFGSSSSNHDGSADIDYLSESHTIATLQSSNSNNNNIEDDPLWGLEDDDAAAAGSGGGKRTSDQAIMAAEQRQMKLVEILSTLGDDFETEKRTVKREQYLKGYFRALTQYASLQSSEQTLWDRRDDLLQACRQSIRTGTPSEQYAACRVLEAGGILLGNDEDYYHDLQGHLTRLVISAHRAVPVRVAALRAIGMAIFVGVDDDVITEEWLDLCEALARPEYRGDTVPSGLRAVALEVWTLLATTIHELYISGKDDMTTGRGLTLLPLLLQCLEQDYDLSLRSAAGECVAWIHTARLALGLLEEDNHGEAQNTTQKQYQQGSWEGSEWEDIMGEIEAVIDQLSNQSGHSMSKKAKKEQRANFRDYLATLQDDGAPEEVVQLPGGSLEFNSWRDIVALQFLRRCLQGGFQMQMLTNPTLQTIFSANGQALHSTNAGMSQLEKRLYMSKTSEAAKLKDLDFKKKREKRQNIKNHFLTADGEDI